MQSNPKQRGKQSKACKAMQSKAKLSKAKASKANQIKAKAIKAKTYPYLETWDTRYGTSERVVLRKNGKFVDNVSLTALKRGQRVASR